MQLAADWFDSNTAAIKHVGLLSLTDIMLVPGGVFPAKSRWVDSHGGIRLTKVRFGGEEGGIPGVYWFAPPPRYVQGTDESIEAGVTFDGCTNYFGAQNREDAGGVVLQGHLPRIVRYTNCTGPIAGRLIHNDPANGGILDIPAYIAAKKVEWNGVDMHQSFSFHYTGVGMKVGEGMWPSDLDTYSYTDKGRVIEPRAHLTCVGTSVPHNSPTRLNFDVATVDPYKCAADSSGITVVKAPLKASFARIIVNLEGNSTLANDLRYTAQVYVAGIATNIIAYYEHTRDGKPRFNFSGAFPLNPNNTIDVRITQASGATTTFTGTITADFDVRQY